MTKRITISTLDAMKASGDKFVMITAYDATFARLASEAGAETILVGDSLGMVLQGHETTIPVSLDAMAYHTECVARARSSFPYRCRPSVHELFQCRRHAPCQHAAHASRCADGQIGGGHLAQR